MTTASVGAARSLLTPTDHALILIDHQSQMAFPLNSMEVGALRANTATIARAARACSANTRGRAETTFSRDPESELLAELQSLETLLDEALEDSFPASDPIAILRREEDE